MIRCASIFPRIGRGLLILAVATAFASSAARADISFVDMFRNDSFQQVGNGSDLTVNGSFFSSDLNSVNPNDYSSVSMIYPGPGSPQDLASSGSPFTNFHFQTGLLPTQAAMDAAYPFGTYQFNASNGSTTDTASFSYTSDDYAKSLPYLTGTNYTDLQGMNASNPFTFLFSPFVTGTQATNSFIFLTIFDYTTNSFVYDAGFLPASTTSLVLPANTLAPGHMFAYELDFSNRDQVPSPGAVFDAQIGFDLRTSGVFSTLPTPEPSTALVAVAAALFVMGGYARRCHTGPGPR